MHSLPAASGKTAIIKTFFNDQWALYQKVMRNDYMFHRESYGKLHEYLKKKFTKPFSFLDLGCGDAEYSSRALSGTKVARYEAIDLADTALGVAKKNMARVECSQSFAQGNFFEALKTRTEKADLIFIGFSLHHLLHDEKGRFLKRCHDLIVPGGAFVCLEPFTREGETRDQYLQRWWTTIHSQWKELTPHEFDLVHEHVFSSDHPESIDALRAFGRAAGFARVDQLWRDQQEFYALLSFET